MIVLAIIGYLLLALYEAIPLYRQKLWNDFWTNAVLGICSFVIVLLLCMGVEIPSPEEPLRKWITSRF